MRLNVLDKQQFMVPPGHPQSLFLENINGRDWWYCPDTPKDEGSLVCRYNDGPLGMMILPMTAVEFMYAHGGPGTPVATGIDDLSTVCARHRTKWHKDLPLRNYEVVVRITETKAAVINLKAPSFREAKAQALVMSKELPAESWEEEESFREAHILTEGGPE